MTPYEKAQLKRAWIHVGTAFAWAMVASIPLAFMCFLAGLSEPECQIVSFVVAVIIMILTTPPQIKPPGPDVKELKP